MLYEICSKKPKTPEQRHSRRSCVFFVNFRMSKCRPGKSVTLSETGPFPSKGCYSIFNIDP